MIIRNQPAWGIDMWLERGIIEPIAINGETLYRFTEKFIIKFYQQHGDSQEQANTRYNKIKDTLLYRKSPA